MQRVHVSGVYAEASLSVSISGVHEGLCYAKILCLVINIGISAAEAVQRAGCKHSHDHMVNDMQCLVTGSCICEGIC